MELQTNVTQPKTNLLMGYNYKYPTQNTTNNEFIQYKRGKSKIISWKKKNTQMTRKSTELKHNAAK